MATTPEPPVPPPPAFPDIEGGECPRCGTPYEPLQEYCLECGLRLPVARGIIAVLSTAWRRRIPWYPGDWIWPVMLAFVIAALAAAVAILARHHNAGESATKTKVSTQPVPISPGTGTGATQTTGPPPTVPGGSGTVPTTAPTAPAPAPPPPPPPAPSGGITAWPAGQNGWTIVLASIPQTSGRATAVREANKAIAKALSQVGVLNSSQFSSLHSGYFVVFSGIYSNLTDARGALRTARSSYPQAYVRQITR